MNQNEMKQAVAKAALEEIRSKLEKDSVIGIGTGSTVNFFIDELAKLKYDFEGAVASSEATAKRLESHGIRVLDLNSAGRLPFYIDGADEVNGRLQMIKGGGAALTREKIVAACSEVFICIADQSKKVDILGDFPLPVEVLPIARSYVGRELVKIGADPQWRQDVVTDNGNWIIDCYNFMLDDPIKLETMINNIAGVVCNGIFAHRQADILLLGSEQGVQRLVYPV